MGTKAGETRYQLPRLLILWNQHRTHLTPPVWNVFYQGRTLALSAQGLYWGLVMEAASAWHVPKFQTSRRKGGCSTESALFVHNSSGAGGLPYQSGNAGNLPETQVPRHQLKTSIARPPKSSQVCCVNFSAQDPNW